jgi:hypothetical protein
MINALNTNSKWCVVFCQKKSQKKYCFSSKKSATFFVKKQTSFFSSKIAESHFFAFLESPAYISANRVGNFFHIEKRQFFHKNSVKFPTHFPDRYLERQSFQGSNFLQLFCPQKSVQMLIFLCSQKCSKIGLFVDNKRIHKMVVSWIFNPVLRWISTLRN